jgi:CheY-like chemotaxis protein
MMGHVMSVTVLVSSTLFSSPLSTFPLVWVGLRALVARTNGQIDLVRSDVAMPRMGGKKLDEALRNLRPDLPLLFMSGYPGQEGGAAVRGMLDGWARSSRY